MLSYNSKRRLAGLLVLTVFMLYILASFSSNVDLKQRIYQSAASRLELTVSGLKVSNKVSDSFTLTGAIINSDGVHQEFNNSIEVALVHSFSPDTENHFREMMIDPFRDQHRIYANSPAMLQHEDGDVIVVMRIWLEKEIWKLNDLTPTNTFSDNYFFIQRFDNEMRPLTKGRVLGIPTPIQWTIGDGPIEPRIFSVNGSTYLTFNTGIFAGSSPFDTTFIWNVEENKALIPEISGGHPMLKHSTATNFPRDKHWSAIVDESKLYFTYNLDPLRVIDCHLQDEADCHFVHREGPVDYEFVDTRDGLRGGTPFLLYQYPYYISVAHGTLYRNCSDSASRCNGRRYYTTHLVIMTIKPRFKIIYVSADIPLPIASLKVPLVRYRYIDHSFLFPVGLLLEGDNSLVLGGHINDHSSVLYRIEGIKKIMSNVMEYDSENINKRGPKVGTLHRYIKDSTSRITGFPFLYS